MSMMNPSSDELDIRMTLRSHLGELFPDARVQQLDEAGEYPLEEMKELAKAGWLGFHIPERFGGVGPSLASYIIAVEELGRISTDIASAYALPLFVAATIDKFATEEQREAVLPAVARGDRRLSFSLSEPDAGSDATSISTIARREGDEWVLNGRKIFSTLAHVEGTTMLLAALTEDQDARRASIFLVPNDLDGIQINRLAINSYRICGTNEVVLDDVRLPVDAIVGEIGTGWESCQYHLSVERLSSAARWVGAMDSMVELATRYSTERESFGKPLIKHQAIGFKLVDMSMQARAARLMLYETVDRMARLNDWHSVEIRRDAAMAKLFASENVQVLARDATQVLGGYGLDSGFPLERHARNARVATIGSGTSEMQRIVISRAMAAAARG